MLTSVLGIRLMVLTGETIPLPASQDVLSAVRRVEVTSAVGSDGDGFQMTLSLTKTMTGEYSLLEGGTLDPDRRVVIAVVFGVTPEVLIDGVITHHQLMPGDKPGAATLTVSGRDISALMDLEEVNEAFPCQPDSVIVTRLLATYARYGIVPRVSPTADVPLPTSRVPRQCETDLRFIRRLAARNNFVFYVEPVAPGASVAYWGAESRAGLPQPALTVNMGADTNVKDIDLTNDELAAVGTKGVFVEPITKMSISIPPLPELRVPPLAARTGTPRRTRLMRTTGNRDPVQALLAATAEAGQAEEPVKSNCVVDAARYGHALRARRTVGLRGVGRTYDGLYYVKSVTHKIEPGSYTQSLMLTREGTGSLSPVLLT
jgi:hypothetical protein